MNYSTSQRFLLTAAWVVPVAQPAMAGGAVLISEGKIEAVLSASESLSLKSAQPDLPAIDLDSAVLTPGLINLHTHLDYTNMAHLETFDGETMFDWLEELVSQSRNQLNHAEALAQSALAGAQEAALAGTSLIVDSTFSGAPAQALAQVGLKGLVGLELFGLDEGQADFLFGLWQERLAQLTATAGSALCQALESGQVRLTVAPHAPYTVSPQLWLKAHKWAKEKGLPLTCHLAESDSEFNWIKDQDKRLHRYLLKVMPKKPAKDLSEESARDCERELDARLRELPWKGHGQTPCQHLNMYELLDEDTIAAHCLKITDADIKILASRQVKVALCPRSNWRLKNGLPRPKTLIDSGITLGLGTDSRASSPSLNLLAEAHYLRERLLEEGKTTDDLALAPQYSQLLFMLTLGGARAVGLAHQTGSLEVGKCADIAAFDLNGALDQPANQEDVLKTIFQHSPNCRLLLVDGKTVVSGGSLL